MTAPTRKPGRPPDESLTQRRRYDILTTAAAVFAEKGYRQTDLQVVADRLRVGKGTIYRYFPSKEILFLEAVDDGMRELLARVDAAVQEHEDSLQQMERAIKAYLHFFEEHPGMVELLVIERAEFRERQKPTYFAYKESDEQRWRRFLEDAMDAGRVRRVPPKQIMEVVGDLLYGAIFTNYFSGRNIPFQRQAQGILDTVFYGILTDEERAHR